MQFLFSDTLNEDLRDILRAPGRLIGSREFAVRCCSRFPRLVIEGWYLFPVGKMSDVGRFLFVAREPVHRQPVAVMVVGVPPGSNQVRLEWLSVKKGYEHQGVETALWITVEEMADIRVVAQIETEAEQKIMATVTRERSRNNRKRRLRKRPAAKHSHA